MRKPTLDQQLFGLTHAIETLHAENNAPYQDEILPEPPRPRSRTNTLDTNGAAPVETIDEEFAQPPASSYDTLANNAEILFQQVHQGELGRFQSFRRRPRTDSNVNHSHHSSPIIEIELEDQQNQDEEIGLSPTANMTDENAQSGNSQDDDDPKIRPGTAGSNTTPGRKSSTLSKAMSIMFDEWGFTSDIKNFLRPKRNMIYLFLQMAILYIAIPALATAAILFYLVDNPPTGRLAHNGEEVDGKLINTDGNEVDPNVTSISYYLLFVGVRQMTTLILALGSQLFLIDFLAIDRGYLFKFGARLPLFIMQARGWPFVLFFWSMFDWALLSGKHPSLVIGCTFKMLFPSSTPVIRTVDSSRLNGIIEFLVWLPASRLPLPSSAFGWNISWEANLLSIFGQACFGNEENVACQSSSCSESSNCISPGPQTIADTRGYNYVGSDRGKNRWTYGQRRR